jgi:hypothetical protein
VIATGSGQASPGVADGGGAAPHGPASNAFAVVHSLALRGVLAHLPEGSDALVQSGLVRSTSGGYELTALGHRRHRALLEIERRALDLELLEMTYERLPAVTRRLRDILTEWEAGSELARRRLVGRLCSAVDAAELILGRSAAVAPRFASYKPRLDAARNRLLDDELEYTHGPGLESILAVWREMTEDYLQTLGLAHDVDDL